MASILQKLRKFFKRQREEPEAEECKESRHQKKRARYISTPAAIQFTPKQVENKRVRRSTYTMHEILSATESRNYEFKSGGRMMQESYLKAYIQKYGSAFLNSEGGVVLGGVQDDGLVTGIECTTRMEANIIYTIKAEFDQFRPKVKDDMYTIKFLPVVRRHTSYPIPNCKVIELHISQGESSFLYEGGTHEVYVRRDGSAHGPIGPIAIKEIAMLNYSKRLQQRRTKHFEEKLVEETKQNEPKIKCIDLTSPSPRRPLLSPSHIALDQLQANYRESRNPATTQRTKPDQSQKLVSRPVAIKRKRVESTSQIESTATAATVKNSKYCNPGKAIETIKGKSNTNPTINNSAIQQSNGSVAKQNTNPVARNPVTNPSKPVVKPSNPVTNSSNGSVAVRNTNPVSSNPAIKPSNPVVKPSNGSVAARNTNPVSSNPAIKSSNPVVKPSNPVTNSSNGSVAVRNTNPVSSNLAIKPSNPVVKPSNPVVNPSNGSVAARNTNPVSSNPAIKSSNPVVKPSNPVVNPTNGSVAARNTNRIASNLVIQPNYGSIAAQCTNPVLGNQAIKPSNPVVKLSNPVVNQGNGSVAAQNTNPASSNPAIKPSNSFVKPSNLVLNPSNGSLVHIIGTSAPLTSSVNASTSIASFRINERPVKRPDAPKQTTAAGFAIHNPNVRETDQRRVTINPVVQSVQYPAVQPQNQSWQYPAVQPQNQSVQETAVQSQVQIGTISNPYDTSYDQRYRSSMSRIKEAGRHFFTNTIKGRFFSR